MKKVISLGEIMLRLSPANDLRFLQTECLDAVFGGSEANVAVALSQLGQPAALLPSFPTMWSAKWLYRFCAVTAWIQVR